MATMLLSETWTGPVLAQGAATPKTPKDAKVVVARGALYGPQHPLVARGLRHRAENPIDIVGIYMKK